MIPIFAPLVPPLPDDESRELLLPAAEPPEEPTEPAFPPEDEELPCAELFCRTVVALENEMLGVEEDELEPYTYEVTLLLGDVGSAHWTETEETSASNLPPAAV